MDGVFSPGSMFALAWSTNGLELQLLMLIVLDNPCHVPYASVQLLYSLMRGRTRGSTPVASFHIASASTECKVTGPHCRMVHPLALRL